MTHEELRELAASYAIDALPDDERRTVEEHLDVCPECTGDVAALRASATELAHSAPFHQRARIRCAPGCGGCGRAAERRARRPESRPASVPAPVERATDDGAVVVRSRGGACRSPDRWLRTRAAGAHQLRGSGAAGGQGQNRSGRAAADRCTGAACPCADRNPARQPDDRHPRVRDVIRVDLKGQAPAAQAIGRAFYSPSRGVLFTANGLPALPGSQVYQLWVVTRSGQPVSAGLLAPDAEGRALVLAEPAPESPAAFAVTVEPAGGVPAPTGARVLLGAL